MHERPAKDVELPGALGEIAEIIGIPAAVRMGEAVGGTRIYIPATVGEDHWLSEIIGRDLAQKIAAHFALGRLGISLDLPLLPRSLRIDMLTARGDSARAIALKLGITRRTVYRHRHRASHLPKGN